MGSRVEIGILDSTIDYTSTTELENRIRDFAPDILGMRCLHYHTDQFHAITKFAKTLNNPPLVVGGGPYVSGATAYALEKDSNLDLVCVGEGEATFKELVEAFHYHRDVTAVPGLHFRSGDVIRDSGARPLIDDLDRVPPPDWTLIDLKRYEGIMGIAPILRLTVPLETSRGCPYRCTYCHELFQKQFRPRSAEHIVNELEVLNGLGVHHISIIDDIFNFYPERVIALFELISKRNLKMSFYYPNGLRGDRMTREAIDTMVGGGSILFTYALESGSRRVQKYVKKHLRFDPFEQAVHYTISKGVMVDMFLMAGFPTETFEEAVATIDFLKKFDVVCMPYLNIVNAFPGTEMFKTLSEGARRAGLPMDSYLDDRYYRGYSMSDIPVGPLSTLSNDQLRAIRLKLFFEYVLDRNRLEKALAIQRRYLTEEELLRKYQSYVPGLESMDQLVNHLARRRKAASSLGACPGENKEFKETLYQNGVI
jgi:radical SAM superfamily enzyme YgiQ (UPF0313 family)